MAGRRSSPPTQRAELTGTASTAWDPVSLLRERFAETEGHELLTRLQDVDLGTYLVDDLLVKTDRASMAWSLEARVPFLDTMVANFAFSLPASHKVRGLEKKRLLRKRGGAAAAGARSCTGASAASRSRRRRGCAASSSRSRARRSSPATLRRQGVAAGREAVQRLLDDHVAGPRGPVAAALGAARVHALVRAARRGHLRDVGSLADAVAR